MFAELTFREEQIIRRNSSHSMAKKKKERKKEKMRNQASVSVQLAHFKFFLWRITKSMNFLMFSRGTER